MRSRLRGPYVSALPVLAIVLGAGLLAAAYASKARQWSVMTDELQTSKLATGIAEHVSLAPEIHGAYYAALNQLYPLVLAPLYGLLSTPAAFDGAHVLNAFLLASSAWPAYLLGRAVTASRAGGYFAAALTAFVPWLVLSATLLTENVAYPAFVWAVLLAYRAIVVPSVRRDAAAVGGLALAYLARTQLFVLALAVPFAVFAQERSLRSALARHRLLAAVYGAAAVAAAVLALIGALTTVFGNYESTIRGNPFPGRIWHSAAVHLDYVVVGTGVVPFILAGAWSLTAAAGAPPRARAFAFLFLILVPLLTLEAASFDVRFTPGGFVQDRYVSYLAPLFAVGAAACVLDRGRPGVRATTSLMVGLAFAVLASAAPYSGQTALYWASPAAAFHRVFGSAAQAVDISTVGFVQWASVAVAVLVAGALWLLPSWLTLSTLGVVLAALGALEAGYVFDRFAVPATTRSQAIEGVRRDWIDAAVPAGASVALVPNPDLSADYWWDAEFWNKSVDRALAVDGRQIFTPFAANEVSFAAKTGRVLGAQPTNFLVLDMTESRFALRGTVPIAVARPLVLVRVARPYRAKWLISGAARDGWIRPGNGARIRIFGALRELAVTLRASADATGPQRFEIRSDGFVSRGQARPGDVATACLPRRRSIKLAVRDGARLHIDGLHTGRCD